MSGQAKGGRDPLVGALLGGKYRIDGMLARGGMGRVYRGTQEPLDRPVAIKVLELTALDPERNEQVEKRFFLEASVCAKLTHPNILTVHDYGRIEGGHGIYIVMEFLEGSSLRTLLKQHRALPVERVLHIARQICAALSEAHENGLVHRDLKPGNVVLVPRGGDPDFVKVVDFGLVKQVSARDDSAEVLTTEGSFLGTPRYMAPEQINGDDVDARTDIYSLGVMLYEALCGQPPFRSKVRGEVPVDLFNAHLRKPPPPFAQHELAAGVPSAVEAVVMRCLEKDPRRRFATMRELLSALDAASRGLADVETRVDPMPVRTLAQALAETLPDEAPSDAVTVATKELPPPAKGMSPSAKWAAALSAFLFLGAGAVVLALLVGRSPADAPTVEVTKVATVPAAAPKEPPVEAAPADDITLRVTSNPTGAAVTWAGKAIGVTPLEQRLERAALKPSADRRLTVTLDGHEAFEQTLELPAEGPLVVHATLERKQPAPSTRSERKRPRRTRRAPSPSPDLDIKVDR